MSRVSFSEFSSGLPVTQVNPKAPRIPEQQGPKGNMIGRILADAPSDIAETFKGVIGAGRDAGENFAEAFTTPNLSITQRFAGAIAAPFSGLVNAGGEALKGGAKLFTTDEFEQATNEALVAGGKAVMSSELGQKARQFYENLPDDQKYTLTNIIGPTANVMTAGFGAGGTQAGSRAIKTSLKSAIKEAPKRTAADAAEAVVRAANPGLEAQENIFQSVKNRFGSLFNNNTQNQSVLTEDVVRQISKEISDDAVRNLGAVDEKQVRKLVEEFAARNSDTPGSISDEQIQLLTQQIADTAKTNERVANSFSDTLRGITTQFSDFAKRTAREAQDTAVQSRRLSQMPEQKASLIKNGADERVVNVIDRSTPEEIPIYRELVEQAKKAEQFPEDPRQLPKVIAGREFLKPVDYVIKQRKLVGQELGDYRKNKLTKTQDIDTNLAFRNFHKYLKDTYQVRFDKEGKIIPDSGTIAASDVPQVQKLYDQLKSDKLNSQVELDQWLQRTYKDYDLVQKREKTFSEEVSTIAERARSEVGKLMPEEYNVLRKRFAQLSTPLNDMVKILGYKGDLDKLTAKELKAGEVALRMFGNAADRPQSAIDNILNVANENGYQSPIDINKLVYVTDQLEDLYDITPSRGFSGSATRGVNQSSVGVATDAATFNVGGLFDRAMSSRATQKEIQESFESYLQYLDEGGERGTFVPAQKAKEQTAKADVEDDIVLENIMKKSVVEVEPDDMRRFEELKLKAQKEALSEEELAEAQAIIERADGELPNPE